MTGYFLRLSTKKQYDLMGALRGPDGIKDEAVKTLVTGRIRHIIFGRDGASVTAAWESRVLTELGVADVKREVLRAGGRFGPNKHYIAHLATAVKASKGHRLWGGRGDDLIAALETKA